MSNSPNKTENALEQRDNERQSIQEIKTQAYVHGYTEREATRLSDQAHTLAQLLHDDSRFAPGSKVLEPGCGTGAQTVILAGANPQVHFTSVDISAESLMVAREQCAKQRLTNVRFCEADLNRLPFAIKQFDHVYVCFLLEHLPEPGAALKHLRQMLKPGGAITVIEGDHGSAYYHPSSEAAQRAIQCQIGLQLNAVGDALIGRRLYPLMIDVGFEAVHVSPRLVYADGSRPDWRAGFTLNTFTAMIEGVRTKVLATKMMDPGAFDQGIVDLKRTAQPDGVFCYTFFKATANKPFV